MARSNVPRVASMPNASERGRLRQTLGFNAPADAHSSELYLSLGRRPETGNSAVTTPPDAAGSHPASQSSSRASSLERFGEASPVSSGGGRSSRHGFMRPFTVFSKRDSTKTPSTPASSRPNSRPGSSHKNSSKPSRPSSGPSTPSSPDLGISSLPSQTVSRASTSPTRASMALGEYYDAVPEYAFAAQGFLGGGITPLSSFRGLPSYDQAQRSRASSMHTNSIGVNSMASTASAGSQGSSTSSGSGGGLRHRRGTRGSRRASMAGGQDAPPVPPLPPLPPSPTTSPSPSPAPSV
ncbi:hypothetical protein M408DRAFT_286725 [Serendipita vermifera MAFF 305830]|uniref:Uncharacterized protein n=1 Tax=Serendipita vermifera MAFF 305830 TaxID=933852 RepID=A0A0C2XNE6_SERVB|nr:hypothetical protein M408DRAFT_286725 [Serendipita vermifera MAFF 305830]